MVNGSAGTCQIHQLLILLIEVMVVDQVISMNHKRSKSMCKITTWNKISGDGWMDKGCIKLIHLLIINYFTKIAKPTLLFLCLYFIDCAFISKTFSHRLSQLPTHMGKVCFSWFCLAALMVIMVTMVESVGKKVKILLLGNHLLVGSKNILT